MRRYVFIGSGAAGLAAAEAVRRQDPSASLTMLTDDPHGYYSRPGLAYYLAGEVPETQLFPWPEKHFRDLNLQLHYDPVTRVMPEEHYLALKNGKKIHYDRLLIATGATAVQPDLPGIDLKGVVKLDSLDDAQEIVSLARRGQTAVIVGGGITALELVEGLAARGMNVHYFLRGDRYWSAVLDEVESRIVEKRLKDDGVTIHYFTNLGEIHGKGGRLSGVQAKVGDKCEEIKCNLLAIAIGIRPRKELAEVSQVRTERGILVDPYLRTNQPDIFAAGDVAQVYDPFSGVYTLDSLWGPAIEQGNAAGMNMTGCNVLYQKLIPFNVTRLAGLITTIIGQVGSEGQQTRKPVKDPDTRSIMRGESEIWRQVPDASVAQTYSGDNRLRLYLNTNRLVGAVIMGDQEISYGIQQMIHQQADLKGLRSRLLEPGAPLADLIQSFWQREGQAYATKIA